MAQCSGSAPVSGVFIQFPNIFLCSCWVFILIAEDLTRDSVASNFIAAAISKKNDVEIELMISFCDMVHIYLNAKQSGHEFEQFS